MHTQLRFEARLHLGFEAKSNQNNPDIRPFPMQTKVWNFSAAHKRKLINTVDWWYLLKKPFTLFVISKWQLDPDFTKRAYKHSYILLSRLISSLKILGFWRACDFNMLTHFEELVYTGLCWFYLIELITFVAIFSRGVTIFILTRHNFCLVSDCLMSHTTSRIHEFASLFTSQI